jgi:outer membrane protein OmpA-like peptidoglycan-associated protein
MDVPADQAAHEEPSPYSVVVDRHRVRRPVGRLYWVAVLLVPVLLTAYVGWSRAAVLESDLTDEVRAALDARTLTDVEVTVDGRQVTALVPTGRDPQTTAALVAAVPGVLSVTIREVYASEAERRACTGIQGKLDTVTRGQRIAFAGGSTSLTRTGRTMVARSAKLLVTCRAVDAVIGGHADSSARDAGALSLRRARTIIAALVRAGVAQERLEPRGYGDQFEVEDGTTAAARSRNERGSITVKGVVR